MKKLTLKLFATGFCLAAIATFSACNNADNPERNTVLASQEVTDEDQQAGTTTATTEVAEIESNRFRTDFTASRDYEGWDTNRDQNLDENEFNDSFYGVWDIDRDGKLNNDEFEKGTTAFSGNNKNNFARDTWDVNKDNTIDRDEFRKGITTAGYYKSWDKNSDARISKDEYITAIMDLWDVDRNGFLDRDWYEDQYDLYFNRNQQ